MSELRFLAGLPSQLAIWFRYDVKRFIPGASEPVQLSAPCR